ncbi:helix-turn-helix transcriptional regulator [Streptomyces sp. NPDC006733]|uniref:helix-turn-helix transcriptional regulator n=1 Tax=Streptomyces sp. NPDC006733 TaxID=3155460 RepID=UPI0033EF3D5F
MNDRRAGNAAEGKRTGEGVDEIHSDDEVDQALLEMRALIESVVAKRRDAPSAGPSLLETTADIGAAAGVLRKLIAEAQSTVDVVLPSDLPTVELLRDALAFAPTSEPGKVVVRVLCSRAFIGKRHGAECLESRPDVQLRVTDAILYGAVIIDRQVALMQSDPEQDHGTRATLVRAPAVVKAINALFASAWRRAAPMTGDLMWKTLSQEIVQCLRRGLTDDAAARELGISVRTYRRHVADIVRALGASSRFQAGFHAAELGLLRTDGTHGPGSSA